MTQLAVSEYKPNLVKLRQHTKKIFGLSAARSIKDTVMTDTIIPNQGVPLAFEGAKYIQIYIFRGNQYKFYYDMRQKSDFLYSLHALFTYVGIPKAMHSDWAAGEETSEEVIKVLNKHKV